MKAVTTPPVDVSSTSTARPSQTAPPVKEDPPPPTTPGDVKYVTAAAIEESGLPLGMRYSILKRVGSDQVEVDPDTTFRAGDRIRVRVEVNDTGYLYIINRGSSGIWKPLFPSPEIGGGSNVVSRGRSYDIPPEHLFTFDEQAGEEKLFIVLCRQPEPDLENLIYELSGSEQQPAEGKPPAADPQPKMLLAQNVVDIRDDFVGRFRNAYARDLIIEKVDPDTPGPMKETAVYAVSATAAPDSRVVVDVSLDHR
ncbi:MAG: DUF4384 domain-containing protein [bacterium]|nr:DUF4384 domain-containing protein [bacterium]